MTTKLPLGEHLTEQDVAEIEARANAATPPPWKVTWSEGEDEDGDENIDLRVCHTAAEAFVDEEGETVPQGMCIGCLGLMGDYDYEDKRWSDETRRQWRADAELVAHARTDIPRLIADWQAMRQLLVALTADKRAGLYYDVPCDKWVCAYCNSTSSLAKHMRHHDDCPIVRGRALVKP